MEDTEYTYQKLCEDVLTLQKRFPFLQVDSIGNSLCGRTLYRLGIGSGKNAVLFAGAFHGMERITSALLMRFFCALAEDVYKRQDQALHTFSYFHSYWKNPLTIPVFALCGLAAIWLAITSTMGDSIIFRLLFAAAGIYLIVHIFTAPGTIYKSLFRTYKKMPNRVAVFSFRDEDFRLSGLQASGVFPYFQITTAYETKNYFYLYFGRENAYFVAKDNFKVGDAKAFRAFLKEKLGKNFKRRTF